MVLGPHTHLGADRRARAGVVSVLHFVSYFVRHFSAEELQGDDFNALVAKKNHLLGKRIREIPGTGPSTVLPWCIACRVGSSRHSHRSAVMGQGAYDQGVPDGNRRCEAHDRR